MSPELIGRDGVSLVFGMEWFPLLGSRPESQARSLARRRRARQMVISSGGAASVGLLRGRLRKARVQRYCSAAALFAHMHPQGAVAAVVPLPGGKQWLVAAHDGAVMTRGDHLYDASAPMHDTLALLKEAHPGLVLLEGPAANESLLDSLFKAAPENGRPLQKMGPMGLSTPAFCVLFAAGAAVITLAGRAVLFGADGPEPEPVVDPTAAWKSAIAESAQFHAVHGVAGLQSVLESLHDLPVATADWHLAETDCSPQGMSWNCRARYRRGDNADNHGFILAARPDWTLSFNPMEGALAAWSVPMQALPLNEVLLRQARQNEARLFSALQSMLPAFAELRLEAPQPLATRAPRDAQQRLIARPPGVKAYQRRSVRVQAPLRSLSLLLPEAAHMSWERIVLQVVPVDQPSLRSSGLRVSLSGVLYEVDDTRPIVADASGVAAQTSERQSGPRSDTGPDDGAAYGT